MSKRRNLYGQFYNQILSVLVLGHQYCPKFRIFMIIFNNSTLEAVFLKHMYQREAAYRRRKQIQELRDHLNQQIIQI